LKLNYLIVADGVYVQDIRIVVGVCMSIFLLKQNTVNKMNESTRVHLLNLVNYYCRR